MLATVALVEGRKQATQSTCREVGLNPAGADKTTSANIVSAPKRVQASYKDISILDIRGDHGGRTEVGWVVGQGRHSLLSNWLRVSTFTVEGARKSRRRLDRVDSSVASLLKLLANLATQQISSMNASGIRLKSRNVPVEITGC